MDFTPIVPTEGPTEVFGGYIASVHSARQVLVRSAASLLVKRAITVPTRLGKVRALVGNPCGRLALIGETACLCVDMEDETWRKELLEDGRFGQVQWLEDGATLAYRTGSHSLTLWSADTGCTCCLRGCKVIVRRGATSTYAVLQRDTRDTVRIIQRRDDRWVTARMVELDTIDAAGLTWSPDGKWLAVHDSIVEYRALFLSCDGCLVRDYRAYADGLGVRTIVWCPSGEAVAIASCDGTVRMLDTLTFAPLMELSHPLVVKDRHPEVWREVQRGYDVVSGALSLPWRADIDGKQGVGAVAFNESGSLVATTSDNAPTTVWIWSLDELCSAAVLLQHSAVRTLRWLEDDTLVWICADDDASSSDRIHAWNPSWPAPRVVPIPADSFDVRWIRSLEPRDMDGRKAVGLVAGSSRAFTVAYAIPESADNGRLHGLLEESSISGSLLAV